MFEEPIVDALCIFHFIFILWIRYINVKKRVMLSIGPLSLICCFDWLCETNTTMIACLRYEVAMTQMQDVTGVFCDGCVVCSSPMGSHWQTIVGGVRRSTIGKRCLALSVDRPLENAV